MMIFDLDGTLIDSRADLTAAVNRMRRSFGLEPWTLEAVVPCIGNGVVRLVERTLTDAPGVDREEAVRRMSAFYRENPTALTTLYDGVSATLAELDRRGIPLAVVTNKPEPATRDILANLEVERYFRVIVGGGGSLSLKPAPDALLYCLERCGAGAASSWMIGDHYTDLEAGRRAGMRRAFAGWGFGDRRSETADLQLNAFPEILNLETA